MESFEEIGAVEEHTLLEMLTSRNEEDIQLGIALANNLPDDRKRYIMMHMTGTGWFIYRNEQSSQWRCHWSMWKQGCYLFIECNPDNDEYLSKLRRPTKY